MRISILSDDPPVAEAVYRALTDNAQNLTEEPVGPPRGLEAGLQDPAVGAGVILCVYRELNQHALKTLRQLRAVVAPTANLVVVAAEAAQAEILQAFRLGASDFLNCDASLPAELRSLLARLSECGSGSASVGQATLVTPSGSIHDALVTSANLAALAARHGSCALLELHVEWGGAALLLNASPSYSWRDLVTRGPTVEPALFAQALSQSAASVRLLASPTEPCDPRLLAGGVIQQIVRLAKKSFDHVVISTDSLPQFLQAAPAEEIDQVLVVSRLDVLSLCNCKNTVGQVHDYAVGRDNVSAAMVDAGRGAGLEVKDAQRVLAPATVYAVPGDAELVSGSINLGAPFVTEYPDARISRAMRELSAGLNLGEPPGPPRKKRGVTRFAGGIARRLRAV